MSPHKNTTFAFDNQLSPVAEEPEEAIGSGASGSGSGTIVQHVSEKSVAANHDLRHNNAAAAAVAPGISPTLPSMGFPNTAIIYQNNRVLFPAHQGTTTTTTIVSSGHHHPHRSHHRQHPQTTTVSYVDGVGGRNAPTVVIREQYWVYSCPRLFRCSGWSRREKILFGVLISLATVVLGLVIVVSALARADADDQRTKTPLEHLFGLNNNGS